MSAVDGGKTKKSTLNSTKNSPATNDKAKKNVKTDVKSVSELQAEIQKLELHIEYLEKNLDPKVFEKKAGITEEQQIALYEETIKRAQETIWRLRNGLTEENTEELNKVNEEIKKLKNKIKEKETAEENLKRELTKVQSERDDLQQKHAETSHTPAESDLEKAESYDQTLKHKENEIKSLTEKVRNLENATKSLSTEKLNTGDEEIKKLKNMLKQKETAEENLKRELKEAKSDLQQKLTETSKEKEDTIKDLQGQLTSVRNNLKDKDEEICRLKETTADENKEKEINIKDLQRQLTSVRDYLKGKEEEIRRLKETTADEKTDLKTLKTGSEMSNNSTKANTGSQEEINILKRQIVDKDAELGKKTSDIQTLGKEIATLQKSHDAAITKLITQEDKTKALEEEYKKKLEKKDETINTLRRENTMEKTTPPGRDDVGNIKQQLSNATREIDELKSRLSKMVGENLTNNNPNITDLSDENRPTKLAEIYSEMYDNEWTDAFEELEKQGSKELKIISDLLNILQDTIKFCGKMAEQYIENLQKSASKLQDKTSTKNQYQKLHLLKELRKSYAPSLADEVFLLYVKEKNLKFDKTPKVEAYTKSCIKLSWLMSVQDPAVVIDEVKTPSKFDGDRYRSYTKSGTTMEFVVWPTMLLHSGGPILIKGVAQCK